MRSENGKVFQFPIRFYSFILFTFQRCGFDLLNGLFAGALCPHCRSNWLCNGALIVLRIVVIHQV